MKRQAWQVLLMSVLAVACAGRVAMPADSPSEAARHRAALATVFVANATSSTLTIAFHSANPPSQEIIIGKVQAGARARLAPVPAGEPIILLARQADGSEFVLPARSLGLDAEWTWEIAHDTKFQKAAQQ